MPEIALPAARFRTGDLKAGLQQMQRALKPHAVARWTAVTFLPFLWRPDAHMFLKPEVTRDFPSRVGHSFASEYGSDLDVRVYERLLDLAGKTESEVADLRPQDRIDVQGFIWVVGSYEDGREVPQP